MQEISTSYLENSKVKRAKKRTRLSFSFNHIVLYMALLVLLILLAFALVPGLIAPFEPVDMQKDRLLLPPSIEHFFGTDYFGRDVFTLVVYGSRTSLIIGIVVVIISAIVGTLIGAIAGYVGGTVDRILMRIIEIIQIIPGMLLALALAAVLGASFFNLVIAISIAAIPGYARVMRGQIISIKHRPFITAAESIGTSKWAIFFKHILPNAYAPLLVIATNGLGTAILTGAALSFLGLGVVSEIPDWGTLLSQGRNYIAAAWWIATFPGLAIALFVLAVNIIGDQLRDVFDPKKKIV